jgi:hypothetical protein
MERTTGNKKRFALQHIISSNEKDHRTIKQDLHLSLSYIQMERTTGPQKNSPFGDLKCSSANIFVWSCGPLNLEIRYAQCKSCFVVPESSTFGVTIS